MGSSFGSSFGTGLGGLGSSNLGFVSIGSSYSCLTSLGGFTARACPCCFEGFLETILTTLPKMSAVFLCS